MPSISALLQHQSQDTRGRAAMALALISTASPNAVASAVLTSPEGLLGHMLTHLSGDDTSKNRSFYATLIGQCALVYDSAGLKKIGDAGAVPYLLKLLKEADKSSQQRVLGSLAVGWQLHNIQWPLGNFGHTWPLRIAFACNQSSLSTAGMLLARRLTFAYCQHLLPCPLAQAWLDNWLIHIDLPYVTLMVSWSTRHIVPYLCMPALPL